MNDGTYVMYSIISLLNIVDLIMETISSSSVRTRTQKLIVRTKTVALV